MDGTGGPVLSSLCGDNAGGAILVYARGGDIYAADVTGAGAVTSVGPWSTSAPAGPERDGGQLAAGSHEYNLAPLDPLPTGVYDMRLTVAGASSSARFVVRR